VSLVATLVLLQGFRESADAGAGGGRAAGARALVTPREMLRSYLSGFELARNRGVQFGLMATFLIMFMQSMSFSFIPLYLSDAGYGTGMISAMVSLNGLAGLTFRFFLSWMVKRVGLERLLIIAGCVAASCLTLLPLASVSAVLFGLVIVVMGSAVGLNLPVSIMIMVNDSAEGDRGKVMGLRLLANRLAQIIGPSLFGVLGQAVGLAGAFHLGGGLLLTAVAGFGVATFGDLRARREVRRPTDDRPPE